MQTCRNLLVVCEHAFQMGFTRLSYVASLSQCFQRGSWLNLSLLACAWLSHQTPPLPLALTWTGHRDLNPVFVIINAIVKHGVASNWDVLEVGDEVMDALECLFKTAMVKKAGLGHKVCCLGILYIKRCDVPVAAQHGMGPLQDGLHRLHCAVLPQEGWAPVMGSQEISALARAPQVQSRVRTCVFDSKA